MSIYDDNNENCYDFEEDPKPNIQVFNEKSSQPDQEYQIQSQSSQFQKSQYLSSNQLIKEQQNSLQFNSSYLPMQFEVIDNQEEEVEINDEEIIKKVYLGTTEVILDNNEEMNQCKKTSKEVLTQEVGNNSYLKKKKQSKKDKEKENKETKNLPIYYYRAILKYTKQKQVSEKLTQKVIKLEKMIKNVTISSLSNLLADQEIKEQAKTYLTSYQFIDDLLRSGKQQDIAPPIKYLKKVYAGCLKPDNLQNWKN